MQPAKLIFTCLVLISLALPVMSGQTSSDMRQPRTDSIRMEQRTTKAVDYRQGSTNHIDLKGTDLMPNAEGKAEVHSRTGRAEIEAKLEHLRPANSLGLQYLTYVLWAISPDGRPNNLGELMVKGNDESSMKATTSLQAFALIVTAEPYFSVTQPSDMVILQNDINNPKGFVRVVDVQYELIPRALYAGQVEPIEKPVYGIQEHTPLSLLEARNAVRIAKDSQAEEYAAAPYQNAKQLLDQAESYFQGKQGHKAIDTVAREAVQAAESARVMALKAEQDAKVEREQRDQQARTEQAQAEAATQARSAAQAQADAATQAQAAAQAEAEREAATQREAEAQQRAQTEAQQRHQAELTAQQQASQAQLAQQQAQLAQQQAQAAQQQAQQAENDRQQMRARLLDQLNQVLETKDTARGLIVSMPDVLFDTGRATLRETARERLAKVAGILIAYPDIKIEVDGYTDSTGGEDFNLRLSQERSDAVHNFLASQGVSQASITTHGFGESNPIASNDTVAGRQENRRVELVVSGESIGAMNQAMPNR